MILTPRILAVFSRKNQAMKNQRLYGVLFSIGLIAATAVILMYYWSVDSWVDMKYVPIYVMITCMVYVILQIGKRYLLKDRNWWDWIYYLGLAAVMVPTFLVEESSEDFYGIVTDFGPLFLLIPIILDGKKMLEK